MNLWSISIVLTQYRAKRLCFIWKRNASECIPISILFRYIFEHKDCEYIYRGQITRLSDSDRLNKVFQYIHTVCRYAINKRVDGQQMGLYTGG